MTSLAKLTSLSTQTLSLLLERQRLQTLGSGPNNSLHVPQITRNLNQIRNGILGMEEKEGQTEAVMLLKSQYERMRSMFGADGEVAGVKRLELVASSPSPPPTSSPSPSPSTPSPTPGESPPPLPLKDTTTSLFNNSISNSNADGPFAPYKDDPESGYASNEEVLQMQRQVMNEQDVHLDNLSRSINRQRDISLQINDELDVHTGLLEGLDHEMDRTESRLTGARRRLDRVAKSAKENSSTVTIGLIILVLLILIIVFKT